MAIIFLTHLAVVIAVLVAATTKLRRSVWGFILTTIFLLDLLSFYISSHGVDVIFWPFLGPLLIPSYTELMFEKGLGYLLLFPLLGWGLSLVLAMLLRRRDLWTSLGALVLHVAGLVFTLTAFEIFVRIELPAKARQVTEADYCYSQKTGVGMLNNVLSELKRPHAIIVDTENVHIYSFKQRKFIVASEWYYVHAHAPDCYGGSRLVLQGS